MNSTSSHSIYIPRMLSKHTEEDVRQKFRHSGFVTRVDFTPINKTHGFNERLDEAFKSAFVHFSDLEEFSAVRHVIEYGNSHKMYLENSNEYWMCFKNIHPIPSTMMNIHQIVDNCSQLELLIEKQEQKIKQQDKDFNELWTKVEDLHTVVYQLIGGLYCQKTQVGEINRNLELLGFIKDGRNKIDEHRWTFWPTTRQGDENERRLDELEKVVNKMVDNLLSGEDDLQDTELYRRKFELVSTSNDDSSSVNTQDAINPDDVIEKVDEQKMADSNFDSSELSDRITDSYEFVWR